MTIEEFHKKHGPAWAHILSISSTTEGLIFLSLQHTQRILNYTDEQIIQHGVGLMFELRGRLRMEAEIMGLATMEEPKESVQVREDYVNPEEEAFAEQERQNNTRPV